MKGKKILLIVSGGIAIYKSLELVRMLIKNGASVKCVMTENATKLIQPLLFASLSHNEVHVDTFKEREEKIGHISLTRESDILVVIPATANIIAKIANGIADDLASTTILASNKKVIVAPAMNQEMWNNKAFNRNLKQIKEDGVIVIEPQSGELACNEYGVGRLAEIKDIYSVIENEIK